MLVALQIASFNPVRCFIQNLLSGLFYSRDNFKFSNQPLQYCDWKVSNLPLKLELLSQPLQCSKSFLQRNDSKHSPTFLPASMIPTHSGKDYMNTFTIRQCSCSLRELKNDDCKHILLKTFP